MMNKLNLTRAAVSLIFSILPAFTLGIGPIASVLINMYGCRPVAVGGTCIASLGFFLSRWWVNIWFYYVTIGIIGGTATGIAVCGTGVGTFVLSYVMDGIVNKWSWLSYSNALLVEAFIILIGLACGFAMKPLPHEASQQRQLARKARAEAERKKLALLLILQKNSVNSEGNAVNAIVEPMLPVDTDETLSTKKSFFSRIADEIDLKLLKNAAFALFVISSVLAGLGFNVVYNFADDLANDLKVIKDQRTYIVMSMGLSNIFGRVMLGNLRDRIPKNQLHLFIITTIISGIAIIVAPLCGSSIALHISYASTFGFFSGGAVTLQVPVLAAVVGDEKQNVAFGVLSLFGGFAVVIGTPIVGGSTNGTLKLDDGVYTGEILDGRANGRGVLMKWDGHRYEGEFINDMPDGKGILLRLHGSNSTEKIYEGRFLENKFDGQGTFYWSDGSRYQGTWKNNQRHGLGQIVYADGRVRKGQWAYDKLIEELQVSNT
ncbi:unnamed protein product [Adineta steineri]|uniref:Uncharacterized protein n=1 Tax=Adineta steineri TaxID=433720 RepID=A0A813UQD2_9BILA|nr:unnamed protein product [Adineta steineri]